MVKWGFVLRGRSQEVKGVLELDYLACFGTLRPTGETPILRSDNELVCLSRHFREACTFYRLTQEEIAPSAPVQNGLIEHFFRSFKEKGVWQQNFTNCAETCHAVRNWLAWYNSDRTHQSRGNLSPHEYRAKEKLPASDPPNQCLRAA